MMYQGLRREVLLYMSNELFHIIIQLFFFVCKASLFLFIILSKKFNKLLIQID